MIIDIHSHMINKNFDINTFKSNFTTKMFLLRLQTRNFDEYYKRMSGELKQSKVQKAVLCAIENVDVCSNNKQTIEICKNNPDFLYGANIDFNSNIESQVKNALENNAVLIKVLPSFQNVDLSDKKYVPFFELLKENNLPLLVHTGIEHTIKGGNQELNNPNKLELASKMGVKIICAHCGAKLNFWEKCYFENWFKLIKKYDNVFGDLSAMILFYRKSYLDKILKSEFLKSKVIFGTDFPCYPYINMSKNSNIFDDWYNMFEKIGFDKNFFNKGAQILNLS